MVNDKDKKVQPELARRPPHDHDGGEPARNSHSSCRTSVLIFSDNIDEPGIRAAAAKAPANCSRRSTQRFVCDDEAVVVPVRLFTDMLNEENNSNDGGHAANSGGGRTDDARAAELLAPTIYGRTENYSMCLILKVAAAKEMEEQRASVAATDTSTAAAAA